MILGPLGLAILSQEVAPASSYDPDAEILFSAMTVAPDSERKTLISDTIAALKDAGIWERLDLLYVLAAHDSLASRLDWKRFVAEPADIWGGAAPVHTVDRGWKGNGGALNTRVPLSTTRVSDTSALVGGFSLTNTSAAGAPFGMRDTATSSWRLEVIPRASSGLMDVRIGNGHTPSLNASVGGTSLGLSVGQRDATGQSAWRNGLLVGSDTTSATGSIKSGRILICAAGRQDSGDDSEHANAQVGGAWIQNPSGDQIAIGFSGLHLSESQHAALNTILRSYLSAVGAI